MNIIRVVARGLLGYIPGFLDLIKNRKEHTGPNSARYCYSVWLRHLVLLNKYGGLDKIPNSVAEIGPGASLGVGIAALVSGVNKYIALDKILHADKERDIKIFFELLDLFRNREPIPGQDEFPSLKPLLENYRFPNYLLTDEWLSNSISEKRLHLIKNSIEQTSNDILDTESLIEYYIPWNSEKIIQEEYIDVIISQAVMEHVIDLNKTYKTMNFWLKNNGLISHQIDFKAHETSDKWYGHRTYSDILWKIMLKGRSYPINRMPYVEHKEIMLYNNFAIIYEDKSKLKLPNSSEIFNKKFRNYGMDELSITNVYVIARKKV